MTRSGKRPNILIFMTDQQRGDTVLPGGGARMPAVAAFAREAVTFTNAYCPTPHCCPSRATFFTGLYPSRHGVWNNICNDMALSRGLKPGVRCWSEDLADAGYRMLFNGKWHVSVEESPRDRGWEELLVSAGHDTLHGLTWDDYRRLAAGENPATVRGEGEILRPGYGTARLYQTLDAPAPHDEEVVRRTVAAIASLSSEKTPWCLYTGLIGPHDPYNIPRCFLDAIRLDEIALPPSFADALEDKPRIYRRMRTTRFGQLSEREVREAIRHYRAYCAYLDECFGRVLHALEAAGSLDDTLVLYVSDHGDYGGDHGLFAKGVPCFRGAYHIPAVLRWPRGGASGMNASLVSLADFGPTFLEAAGLAVPDGLAGASLMPFLRGETPGCWRDEMHTQFNGVELYYCQRSVMTRDHKYVFNGFDDDELYDLRTDPHEMVNLAALPDAEPVKRDLCGRMWRFAHRQDDAMINPYITVGLAPYGPGEGCCK